MCENQEKPDDKPDEATPSDALPDHNLIPPVFDIVTEGFSEDRIEKKSIIEIIPEVISNDDKK